MTTEQDRCPSRIAHESGAVLRCQDIPGHIGNHVTVREQWTDDNEQVIADWPDQPAGADTAVEQLEVHHARGKERTDGEAAVLEPKMATGGVVRSGPAVVGDVTR